MASPSPQLSPAFQLSSQGRSQEVYCPGTVVGAQGLETGEDMEGEMLLGFSFPATEDSQEANTKVQ